MKEHLYIYAYDKDTSPSNLLGISIAFLKFGNIRPALSSKASSLMVGRQEMV